MAVFDWPESLIPQRCAIGSQSAGEDFKSPYNGTVQQVDYVAERFTLNATLAQRRRANAGEVEAFLFRLRGGGNRVRAWHFSRPVPAGTLRGTPTLKTTVNRGAASVVLENCTGTNLIRYGGFDLDGGSGIATGWIAYDTGAPSGVARDTDVISGSDRAQRIFTTTLGPDVADHAGVRLLDFVSVSAGQAYTFSANAYTGLTGYEVVLYVQWNNGASFVGDTGAAVAADNGAGGYRRLSVSGVAPPTANRAYLYLWIQKNTGGVAANLFLNNAQFSAGGQSEWTLTTVKAGDMLGIGGQLLMVAENATANDAGEMTVPLIHRIRGTINAGAAVTWNKPTAEFTVPSRFASIVHFPGGIEGAGLDLEEYWAP
jgi:hypothetical protein